MKNQTFLIISINIAALMVLMDLSAINIALPTIKEYFDISVTTVSLILMSSMLTATGTALIMGKFIESQNSKTILTTAFLLFGITTTITSQISNFYWLIPIRFIQGIAEAALYVSGPALIKQLVAASKQQKEYGRWMMSCGLGISLGPLIGGLLIHSFGWQTVFLINLPLSIIGILFAYQIKIENPKIDPNKVDILGGIYSFLFLGFFILFFNLVTSSSVNVLSKLGSASASLLFLILFIKQEKTSSTPVLDLKLFKTINFRQANLGFLLFFLVNIGSRFLRPFYFEETRFLNPSTSGILMMVSPSVMLVLSYFSHLFRNYFSTRNMVILGNILLSISMLMFSFWNTDSSMIFIIVSMVILGLAMGFYYPATTQIGMKSLPQGKHGMGSASISISKSIGKLMGVLLFGLFFQVSFEFFSHQNLSYFLIKSEAIQLVFTVAFGISILNTLLSLGIKNEK
ncbi:MULTISPECIES: MFS transporter [unclassified Lentimicrobium]|uniref:MFS transporter n=1 Tax=unclassified Lentimicrobium TaxID=2677434 RepID=UPI00155314FF|nr:MULTISPECIES: MFS transporter [unclassified Lentimicrobium]NPD47871.1 MFS transporter [Lentimicrobium sp. S6]NPD83546.1 MFS transporter [Lentimicrobium sp. L6]NPD85965.1 MFS transporter [Lentimicrobium sp. L6]